MLSLYHHQITTDALGKQFSPTALAAIIQANLHQDDWQYLLGGYPHHHFDDSEFERTYAYLDQQRQIILETLILDTLPTPAWEAFGKITHALQDFYAHSNYIHLWLDQNAPDHDNGETSPAPAELDPLIPDLLASPHLFSARSILLPEILGRLPLLGRLLTPLFPPDSHIRMNLDQPSTGPLFPYAVIAARKRTEKEFESLSQHIRTLHSHQALQKFVDQ